ncbi:MAG: efflux RND transporter permease subunit [Alphaproteobacteria bacterium]|nr:efflux RND transporter permease subunit [Alphaproteobacteria bacterium]
MNHIVDWALARLRLTLSALVAVLVMGTVAYFSIPKEADPDIPVPFFSVVTILPGISPEDAERLIVRPLETQLKTVEGLKRMTSTASQGYAAIQLEFDVNFDKNLARQRVQEKVDVARPELPQDSEEPQVNEFNIALEPVISIVLSGTVQERTMLRTAQRLEREIESIPGVLSAELSGEREEVLEVVIDPARVQSFGVSSSDLFRVVTANNQLIPAGNVDTGRGRFAVKVPGLVETPEDVLNLPVKVSGGSVVTLRDIADVRRTFLDADTYLRFNGRPAIAIEVTKRIGENIVDTIKRVKALIETQRSQIPAGISVDYSFDSSNWIDSQLTHLTNAILLAIALVMVVVVAALGLRSGLIVGVSIPASFLIGFMCLWLGGYTLNMMIMMGMLITVGLLVDNGIIVVEFADRKLTEGFSKREAFTLAARRMFWPVVSSTATTLAAFAPMLFWPGVSGKFMSYLPLTMIFIMTASMVVALIFLPAIGVLFGKADNVHPATERAIHLSESGDLYAIGGWVGTYARLVTKAVERPFLVLGMVAVTLVAITAGLFMYGRGVEFFVETDAFQASLFVRARGNLSADEKRDLIIEAERRVLGTPGLHAAYAVSGGGGGGNIFGGQVPVDTIGRLSMELKPYAERGPSKPIWNEVKRRLGTIPGIFMELSEAQGGPPTGKAIQIEIGSENYALLDKVTDQVRKHLDGMEGLRDIEDSRPLPGIEWALTIDREQAGLFGANVGTVGAAVQLVTNGIKVGEYRPDDSENEIDIRVRYPQADRGIGALDELYINTAGGSVPITNFVARKAQQQVNRLQRVDSLRIWTIRANVNTEQNFNITERIGEIRKWIEAEGLDTKVRVKFRGSDEQQNESAQFLLVAFAVAMLVIAGILIIQFNNFWHAAVILSAVVFSVFGALLGMLIEGQLFSVIMSGTGIVALIGVMVNHNIVLIDTFHHLRDEGFPPMDAIIRTGVQRMRPVLLTTWTAIFGLLPLMYKIDVDFVTREVHYGGPSAEWWVPLATAIVYGLAFSTLLTLFVTPAMLAIEQRYWAKDRKNWGKMQTGPVAQPAPAE